MKKAITTLTLLDLFFILFLSLSGAAEGVFSEVIYYLAFLVPTAIGIYYIHDRGDGAKISLISLKKRTTPQVLLIFFPSLCIIIAIAVLTSLVMGLLGFDNPSAVKEPIITALLIHALIPALLEELLFRYIPLKMLTPYSKRAAVFISALFFSLVHANLFQMPYALCAGVIFAFIDLYTESLIPSLLLHFINNTLSVISMLYPAQEPIIYITVGSLGAVSVILFFLMRRLFDREAAGEIFKKTGKEILPASAISLIIISLFIAVSSLF